MMVASKVNGKPEDLATTAPMVKIEMPEVTSTNDDVIETFKPEMTVPSQERDDPEDTSSSVQIEMPEVMSSAVKEFQNERPTTGQIKKAEETWKESKNSTSAFEISRSEAAKLRPQTPSLPRLMDLHIPRRERPQTPPLPRLMDLHIPRRETH